MGYREDMATIRATRAHLLDRISMSDEGTQCAECRAKQLATVAAFTVAICLTGVVAYKIGVSRGA